MAPPPARMRCGASISSLGFGGGISIRTALLKQFERNDAERVGEPTKNSQSPSALHTVLHNLLHTLLHNGDEAQRSPSLTPRWLVEHRLPPSPPRGPGAVALGTG